MSDLPYSKLLKIKEGLVPAATNGLLGEGNLTIIYDVGEYRFGYIVLIPTIQGFGTWKPVPLSIDINEDFYRDNDNRLWIALEVKLFPNRSFNPIDSKDKVALLVSAIKSYCRGASVLCHSEGLVKEVLEELKGITYMAGGSSVGPMTHTMCVIPMGKEGLSIVYISRHDRNLIPETVYCDGYLYPPTCNFNYDSDNWGDESMEPVRPLSYDEKKFIKGVMKVDMTFTND